jgi:3-dehydroquinate synthase
MGELPAMLEGASRVAVLYPEALESRASHVVELVSAAGLRPLTIALPDAEAAKTASVMEMCWNSLGEAGFTRNDVIVGLGGGATTDVAGFVAATWLRGIRVVHMPTTLLGMVDAAVGGKTGINTAAGKNLVGAFWSPSGVLCDVDALQSLPKADLIAGMAEIVKIGFVRDVSILDDIERDPIQAVDPSGALLVDLARRAIEVKAEVVSADFRESAAIGREVLNYGHTFGHAIERTENYSWRHGEAVAVGLVYVAELAHLAGRLGQDDVARHRRVLELLGLPTTYAPDRWELLHSAMAVDKKARGSVLRFIVLQGIGNPVALDGPESALLEAAYEAISG